MKMKKQSRITKQYKNKKLGYEILTQKKQKRYISPTEEEKKKYFPKPSKTINKQRIDFKNSTKSDSKQSKEFSSKTTVASNQDKNSEDTNPEKFELSTKTKNIISSILQVNQKKTEKAVNKPEPLLSQRTLAKLSEIPNKKKNSNLHDNIQQPPKLSETSLKIIEELNINRQNRFNRIKDNSTKFERSDSSFSLRFKYEELLNRELPLPINYKQLYKSFCKLDQIINLNKIRAIGKKNTFDTLSETIEQTTHKRFSIQTLQQILYVVPHFYILKYQLKADDDFKKDYDLYIDIPKDYIQRQEATYDTYYDFSSIMFPKDSFDNVLNPIPQKEQIKRQNIFKDRLYKIVSMHHCSFLSQNGYEQFNPITNKTWHSEFNLDECPDIPIFNIQPKPSNSQIFDSIMYDDTRSDIMKSALNLVNKEMNTKIEEPKKAVESELSKYVSSNFLNKLKIKEKAKKITDEIIDYKSKIINNQSRKKVCIEILNQMKTLILINPNRMFGFTLSEMSHMLKNSCSIINNDLDEKEISSILIKMSQKFPDLIKIKSSTYLAKPVVVMNIDKELPKDDELNDI